MPTIHDKFMTEGGRREGHGAMEKEDNQSGMKGKPRQMW